MRVSHRILSRIVVKFVRYCSLFVDITMMDFGFWSCPDFNVVKDYLNNINDIYFFHHDR